MDEPLQIAICEDTKSDEERLLSILQVCAIPSVPTVFSCGEAFLETFQPGKYDLLLSDIYMGGISGVETVTRVRESDQEIPVAFITTSTDHALEGYRLNVLKYIEKPFDQRDIEETLALAQMKRSSAPSLMFHNNGREERVRLARILYLEQQTHHVNIFLRDGQEVQVYEKLSALLPQLNEAGFFQSHKSYSVNLSFVRGVDQELRCFLMQNGDNVPIRRESMGKAKQTFQEHLFRKTRGGGL